MKKIHIAFLSIVLLWSFSSVFAMNPKGELKIDLTDQRKVFETEIGSDLVLRVVKDSSVKHRDFGWLLEVVQKPYRLNSHNLIYTNKTGTTADRSQVYAWHIAGREFSNYRVLMVKGHLQKIRIDLINPKIEGTGEEARFVSGKLKINWSR